MKVEVREDDGHTRQYLVSYKGFECLSGVQADIPERRARGMAVTEVRQRVNQMYRTIDALFPAKGRI